MHESLVEDVACVRSLGYKVKLDTNGLLPGMIQRISPDYLAVDLKTLPSLYPVLLGSPYGDVERRLQDTLRIVKHMEDAAEVRMTIAPGIVDQTIILQLGELLQGVKKLFLQPMQQRIPLFDPVFNSLVPISLDEIRNYRDCLSEFVETCVVRGEG